MILSCFFALSSLVAGPVSSPPWADTVIHLYDTADVAVLRADSLTSQAPPSLRSSATQGSDTGAYRLDLSGSKSLSVSTGQGEGVGVDASLFINAKGQVADNV